jgi:hypothetical protein
MVVRRARNTCAPSSSHTRTSSAALRSPAEVPAHRKRRCGRSRRTTRGPRAVMTAGSRPCSCHRPAPADGRPSVGATTRCHGVWPAGACPARALPGSSPSWRRTGGARNGGTRTRTRVLVPDGGACGPRKTIPPTGMADSGATGAPSPCAARSPSRWPPSRLLTGRVMAASHRRSLVPPRHGSVNDGHRSSHDRVGLPSHSRNLGVALVERSIRLARPSSVRFPRGTR